MDKVVLSQEQLAQLKQYIAKRSPRFADPLVMEEILDHFACKVEELLTRQPGADLATVMLQAHRSFGVKGFAPIADHVEQNLLKKYQRISYKEIRSVLLSPHTIGMLAIGVLVYMLVQSILGILPKDASIILINAPLLIYWILLMIYHHRKLKKLRTYKVLWAAAYQASPISLLLSNVASHLILAIFFVPRNINPVFTAYTIAAMSMFSVFSFIVQSRLFNQAKQEAEAAISQQISVS